MIKLVVTMQIKPGRRREFIDLFNSLQPDVLAEEGCYEYHLYEEIEGGSADPDPEKLILLEKWESVEHLQAHLATDHMRVFKEKAAGLRTSVDLRIVAPI